MFDVVIVLNVFAVRILILCMCVHACIPSLILEVWDKGSSQLEYMLLGFPSDPVYCPPQNTLSQQLPSSCLHVLSEFVLRSLYLFSFGACLLA